jgi:regulation of enolase protein 1 (concanavalin A-like superfamily)
MRMLGCLMLAVCGCGGSNQPSTATTSKPLPSAPAAVKPAENWVAVEMKPGWGNFVDPDGDCKHAWNGGKLSFSAPGKQRELQGNGKQNAPRLLVERTGDFAMIVRASGKLAPQPVAAGSKFAPYHGAGILMWHSDRYFIRMERAKILAPNLQEITYVNFEVQSPNGPLPIKQHQLPPDENVFLRIERRDDRVAGSVSRDGATWTALGEAPFPATNPIKVGVAAVNGTEVPFSPEFSDFRFFEGIKQ